MLSEDERALRDGVRELLQTECPPSHVRAAFEHRTSDRDVWERLAQGGLVGATAPEAQGGLGQSLVALLPWLEEAGRVALPEPLLETTAVALPLLLELADERLLEAWVPRLVAGKAVAVVGPSDKVFPTPLVNHAASADLLLLHECTSVDGPSSREGSRGAPKSLDTAVSSKFRPTLHAVTRGDVELVSAPSVDGTQRLARVLWTPKASTRVAEGEHARRLVQTAFERGAVAAAALSLGVCRKLLEMTVEYVKARHQFGRAIGSFAAVKHRLADALMRVEFATPLVYQAARHFEPGAGTGEIRRAEADTSTGSAPDRPVASRAVHVSMAKVYASEAAGHCAKAALQCHGAMGYSCEYDLHLWMKRAWALACDWGDVGWHKRRLADALVDGHNFQ